MHVAARAMQTSHLVVAGGMAWDRVFPRAHSLNVAFGPDRRSDDDLGRTSCARSRRGACCPPACSGSAVNARRRGVSTVCPTPVEGRARSVCGTARCPTTSRWSRCSCPDATRRSVSNRSTRSTTSLRWSARRSPSCSRVTPCHTPSSATAWARSSPSTRPSHWRASAARRRRSCSCPADGRPTRCTTASQPTTCPTTSSSTRCRVLTAAFPTRCARSRTCWPCSSRPSGPTSRRWRPTPPARRRRCGARCGCTAARRTATRSRRSCAGWQRVAEQEISMRTFAGDHFYLNEPGRALPHVLDIAGHG